MGESLIVEKDHRLFERGEASRGLFVVCEGAIQAIGPQPDGRREIARIVRPGDVLGLRAAVGDVPHTETATTLTPCKLRFVPSENFRDFLVDYIDACVWCAHFL